jgi:hypothetical protein
MVEEKSHVEHVVRLAQQAENTDYMGQLQLVYLIRADYLPHTRCWW